MPSRGLTSSGDALSLEGVHAAQGHGVKGSWPARGSNLASLVELSHDAVISRCLNGLITGWNAAAERLFGYRAEEVVGRPYALLVPPDCLAEAEDHARKVVRGEPVPAHETARRHRSGRDLNVIVSVAPLADESGRPAGGASIVRDMTPVRRLEEQLRQAQKMEAIGRLAGGVAHDFNNLLTVITGHASLILASLPVDAPHREPVEQIQKAGDRAAGLTQQLLTYSRRQELRLEVVDLNAVLRDTESLLRPLIGEDVDLRLFPGEGLGCIRAEPTQVEQVIMNLALNARDAMPTGGRLTIATANVQRERVGADNGPAGDCVRLTVTDTGCGMDEGTIARLFEPFFTTKGQGKGTGLGLATVYGIVKQSGGHIEVQSRVGVGTRFTVYLPAVEGVASSPEAVRQDLPGGTETVLLVEDDAAVRGVAARVLAGRGYRVLEAADGDEALSLQARQDGPIHLLLTDVVMPRLSGPRLAALVRMARPGIRVLFLSAYAEDTTRRHGIAAGESFLQKPYTVGGLARKVREVLDGPE